MNSVTPKSLADNANFQNVVEPFLEQPGLPFAEILAAKDMQHAFAERDALFATDAVFSTGRKKLEIRH